MDTEHPADILREMLRHMKSAAPDTRQFIERQIRNNNRKFEKQEIAKETIRRLRIQNKKLLQQVKLSKEQMKRGNAERSQLLLKFTRMEKLIGLLADALGSCKNCWGQDYDCKTCKGHGRPGWKKSKLRPFNLYVRPALEK